jgi:hypothetical protein
MGIRIAAERPVTHPVALILVERDGRDVLPSDVLLDVELRPVEQRVNP